jgi:hypothetical protein
MRREVARRLAHDVGKYVARTARNLAPDDAVDAELAAMLARDLYELGAAGERASAVLDRLAPAARERHVADARRLLTEADALEPRVRAAEPRAVARAREIALAVERLLRQAASQP